MKFRIQSLYANVNKHETIETSRFKDISTNLTNDKRITDAFKINMRWTHIDMPWSVGFTGVNTVIFEGKEHLSVMAHQTGEGFAKYDCYIIGKLALENIDTMCKRFNWDLLVYGRLNKGQITMPHRPFDNERFQRKYINMKLGDEKPYLTWTVFHEILGEEYSIFK